MKFLNDMRPPYELTFNDVFMVPSLGALQSRGDVKLATPDGVGTQIPLVVANMNAVAGKRMAEATARRGGLTILPQDMPADELQKTIDYVKSRHAIYETPVRLTPDQRIADALGLIHKRSHGAVIVTDEAGKPVGIFTEKDAQDQDRFTQLKDVMTTELVVLREGESLPAMYAKLDKSRLKMAPVTNKQGELIGVVTRQGLVRSKVLQPALDSQGRLRVGAAIGINGDVAAKAAHALQLGADVLVVDTAHGHQTKMLAALKAVRALNPGVPVVAGNVVTAAAARDLLEAGADIIKVGIGPGAMCTTRMMTGVGRPQFSAVLECAAVARQAGKAAWADGGIRHPRDVALALAAGASNVMFASWLAGTFESVGDVHTEESGRMYKVNYGMASRRAVTGRTASDERFIAAQKELYEEGISSSRMYIDPERPGVEDIIDQVVAGLRSSMSYAGAATINEFYDRAIVGVQSAAGFAEGRAVSSSW